MITRITVENFKSHEHTVIEPGRVTLLVGPNGAGKTALLQAICSLLRTRNEAWDSVFQGEQGEDNVCRQGQDMFDIRIEGENFSDPLSKEALLPWGVSIRVIKRNESAVCRAYPHWSNIFFESGKSLESLREGPLNLDGLEGVFSEKFAYLKAAVRNLAKPSHTEKIPPEIDEDGSNLASVVANLMTYSPENRQPLEKALSEIVPAVEKVLVRLVKVTRTETKYIKVEAANIPYQEKREFVGHELVFDTRSAKGVPAHSMSEGSLMVLAFLTLMLSPNAPTLALLEDVEQGLHPLAQRKLMQVLKEFAEKYDRQIILTTHSPYIVDELDAKDVWVMALDKEGITRTKRLSEHPNAKRALEVLTTGELWDAEGESWVTKESVPEEQVNA